MGRKFGPEDIWDATWKVTDLMMDDTKHEHGPRTCNDIANQTGVNRRLVDTIIGILVDKSDAERFEQPQRPGRQRPPKYQWKVAILPYSRLTWNVVTRKTLDQFNRHQVESNQPDRQYKSLGELQKTVCEEYSLPIEDFFDKDGKVRLRHIGGQKRRCAVIPQESPDEVYKMMVREFHSRVSTKATR